MKNNKVCLITGASGGIGGAIAHVLAANGYTLILQGRNEDKLLSLQQSLPNITPPNKASPSKTFILLGDLTKAQDREYILTEAFRLGPIDLLVNSAGTSCFSPLETMEQQNIEQLININLTAPVLFTQGFVQKINEKTTTINSPNAGSTNAESTITKTTIVNIGSAFGFIGHPGFSVYCASKFGLRGFTESLARELSDSAIRVAFFAPRATKTTINTDQVNALNAALGNTVDSPEFVAQQFMLLLNSNSNRKVVGWPEKLFSRINGILPELVDRALNSKLSQIKQFFRAQVTIPNHTPEKISPELTSLASVKIEEINHEKA